MAKPRTAGSRPGAAETTAKVTTASRIWLTFVATARLAASLSRTPPLRRTSQRMVPSGMLWTAMARATKMPKGRLATMAMPMATPSEAEWSVLTSSTL